MTWTGRRAFWTQAIGMGLLILTLILVAFLSGCRSADKPFFDAVSANWDAIGHQYVKYVAGDATLSAAQREAYLDTANLFTAAIEQRRKVVYGDPNAQ